MHALRIKSVSCLLFVACAAFAQVEPQTSETGAVNFYSNGGWSFGLPATRAFVGTVISPSKTTLPSVGFGTSVKAWKFVEPFVDFTVIDTGKAFAQQGSLRSEVESSTFSLHGGVRFAAGSSRFRPYAQFGAGMLRQDLKGNFIVNGNTTPVSGSGSTGSFLYGGGFRYFVGRKWGSTIGFDGYRASRPFTTGGQNFSRLTFGIFYQTKPGIE